MPKRRRKCYRNWQINCLRLSFRCRRVRTKKSQRPRSQRQLLQSRLLNNSVRTKQKRGRVMRRKISKGISCLSGRPLAAKHSHTSKRQTTQESYPSRLKVASNSNTQQGSYNSVFRRTKSTTLMSSAMFTLTNPMILRSQFTPRSK